MSTACVRRDEEKLGPPAIAHDDALPLDGGGLRERGVRARRKMARRKAGNDDKIKIEEGERGADGRGFRLGNG